MDETTIRKLKKDLCGVVKFYADKGMTSPQIVNETKTALSALSKLLTIEAMEKVQAGGYDERGNSYDRDTQGRYTRDGYADNDWKTKLYQKMENAGPEEKEMLHAFMNRI